MIGVKFVRKSLELGIGLAFGVALLALTACYAEQVALDLSGDTTVSEGAIAAYTAELTGATHLLAYVIWYP